MAKILLVDDDFEFRRFMSELLRVSGHEIMQATDGTDALAFLSGKNGAPWPDLLIVDFNMTQMGGYELVRRLRAQEETRDIPVLMITGTTKDIKELVELEGVKYLRKLARIDEISAAVYEMIKSRPIRNGTEHGMPVETSAGPIEFEPPIPSSNDAKPESAPAPIAFEPPILFPNGAKPEIDPPNPGIEAPAPPFVFSGGEGISANDNIKRLMLRSSELTHLIEGNIELSPSEDKTIDAASIEDENSPMVQLVNGILAEAILQGSSDIHFEPKEQEMLVRFRIDGVLQPRYRLAAKLKSNLAARIKVMANLNISERRMPQDGRFALRLQDGKQVQFRTSTLPALYGEKIVLRLLRSGKIETHVEQVFSRPRDLECVRTALKSPTGLILLTGPTGGGKTTTLYAMIEVLNTPDKNILTVEDPIEYQVPELTQVPVKADIGYTFEKILRACLRQDPNVILVGEIRDTETSEIVVKAAMTGHLVLSTLHTNYAPMAPYRLANMGLKPFLIAGALKLVVAQRLIRLLCPHCKQKAELSKEDAVNLTDNERAQFKEVYLPKGCPECRGIGYIGRRPVMEVMPIRSHEMRQMILDCVNPDEITKQAIAEGMTPLRQGALELAAMGLTSVSEAFTVYYVD